MSRTSSTAENRAKALTVDVILAFPIRRDDDTTIDKITVRRPKVRDRMDVQRSKDSDPDKELKLVAKVTDLSPNEVEELDVADYAYIQEVLEGFFSARSAS